MEEELIGGNLCGEISYDPLELGAWVVMAFDLCQSGVVSEGVVGRHIESVRRPGR